MDLTPAPRTLTDDELLRRVADLVGHSRATEAEIVAHIAEVDARRLYAREACSSMFAYCTELLHFSEAEAYLRIAAARASREHPVLLGMLADGRLHLSAIERLAAHLTPANRDAVLARAAHRTKRQVEELVAELAPRPDAPTLVRRLPAPLSARTPVRSDAGEPAPLVFELRPDGVAEHSTEATTSVGNELRPDGVRGFEHGNAGGGGVAAQLTAARSRVVVEPTAPGRYKFQFTAGAELRDKLERLKALMHHAIPDGDLTAIIEHAVSEKLERLEARRFARVKRPRSRPDSAVTTLAPTVAALAPAVAELAPAEHDAARDAGARGRSSRAIPAAIRRAVHTRDGGRCRYTDAVGRRCTSRHDLEFHHRHPYGHGGAHTVANLCLVCATHHRMIGEADCGHASRPHRTAGAGTASGAPPASSS